MRGRRLPGDRDDRWPWGLCAVWPGAEWLGATVGVSWCRMAMRSIGRFVNPPQRGARDRPGSTAQQRSASPARSPTAGPSSPTAATASP
jgi:hypothetical protein